MTSKHPLVVLSSLLLCGGCAVHIDKPTHMTAGQSPHSVYSVDGSVHLDAHARARKIRSVDGDITLDAFAQATSIHAVDGNVTMGRQAQSKHGVASVDGRVELDRGVRVGGDVRTYHGDVEAVDADIAGGIRTVSGHIVLRGITHVAGGIQLDKPKPNAHDTANERLPVVVIGPGVVVDGPIVALRGGTLQVSRQAHIGHVHGLVPQWFDGDPPGLAGSHGATP